MLYCTCAANDLYLYAIYLKLPVAAVSNYIFAIISLPLFAFNLILFLFLRPSILV